MIRQPMDLFPKPTFPAYYAPALGRPQWARRQLAIKAMTERGASKTGEVAEAMAICFEREDAAGAPWCPPRDAAALRYWITDRSRELGTGLRRAVRFARLAFLADGRDHLRFVYLLPALRARHFEAAVRAAAAAGRLDARAVEIGTGGVILKEDAVKPASAPDGPGFEIGYAQMPRLAALLDILHNALGYGPVADVLQPLFARAPPAAAADRAASELQAKFGAWLSERLDSPHHLRQAHAIRAFLVSRGRVEPEAIDDEAILAFWTGRAAARDEEVEGFRLFVSAARALLRYRRALRDAIAARELERAKAIGAGPENGGIDLDRLLPRETDFGAWRSPLVALAGPSGGAVKWLNKKERLQLLNYLGGPRPDADEDGGGEGDDGDAGEETGLAGRERFDLRFLRTLLRADVFGGAQASIVARLRKRVSAQAAIEMALEPLGESPYDNCAAAYAAIRDQLHLEGMAALIALMEAGAAESLTLLRHLGGIEAVEAILPLPGRTGEGSPGGSEEDAAGEMDYGSFERDAAPVLRKAAASFGNPAPSAAGDLIEAARTASRKVSRAGFGREERSGAEVLAALRRSAPAVPEVLREIDRLLTAFSGKSLREQAEEDRECFSTAFRQIYRVAADEQ